MLREGESVEAEAPVDRLIKNPFPHLLIRMSRFHLMDEAYVFVPVMLGIRVDDNPSAKLKLSL